MANNAIGMVTDVKATGAVPHPSSLAAVTRRTATAAGAAVDMAVVEGTVVATSAVVKLLLLFHQMPSPMAFPLVVSRALPFTSRM